MSSHDFASPLASALRSNGSISAPVNTLTGSTLACYNLGILGDPFSAAGSFTDLLNGNTFSFPDSTFSNTWVDPFMSGMGENTLNNLAGSMTNNFNGIGFEPTQHLGTFSNLGSSPFNTFGTTGYAVNGGAQGPYNFDGIPTYSTMLTPPVQDVQPGSSSHSPAHPAPCLSHLPSPLSCLWWPCHHIKLLSTLLCAQGLVLVHQLFLHPHLSHLPSPLSCLWWPCHHHIKLLLTLLSSWHPFPPQLSLLWSTHEKCTS